MFSYQKLSTKDKTRDQKPALSKEDEDFGAVGGATATRAGTDAPKLAESTAVATVKPVADPAVAAPVVSSPAAKVILCAPAAKSAVAVWQTMVRVAAVILQVDVNVAVPAPSGTRTPAGVAFPLK